MTEGWATGQGQVSRVEWFAHRYANLTRNVESFVRGKPDVVATALVCLLAEGHLLIDDVPGVGKTSLAKAIAQSIDGAMQRIQFTPDLLPTDVTGVQVYDPASASSCSTPGPCSPTSCSATRSTAPRPRPSRRCSR